MSIFLKHYIFVGIIFLLAVWNLYYSFNYKMISRKLSDYYEMEEDIIENQARYEILIEELSSKEIIEKLALDLGLEKKDEKDIYYLYY